MSEEKTKSWYVFEGSGEQHDDIEKRLPEPPRWRSFKGEVSKERELSADPQLERRFGKLGEGKTLLVDEDELDLINAAIYLRRPLLVTGKPGTGKSTLAYAIVHELKLGPVLRWSITSRSTIQEGLYQYDAIGRLQALQENEDENKVESLGQFTRLGPLGTALLPSAKPRVLLIDEIDKSNIDLPNDLLNIFEEGEFNIPELQRVAAVQEDIAVRAADGDDLVNINKGYVQCQQFPITILTSNGERELPPAFLRRCLRLNIAPPNEEKLSKIVEAHFGEAKEAEQAQRNELIDAFLKKRENSGALATDQLLNAMYMIGKNVDINADNAKEKLIDSIIKDIGSA